MKPRRDIDDIDSLFDQEEAQRRRDERAAIIASGAERQAMLDRQEAIERERAKASMLAATSSFLAREYQHAGVAPPRVNAAGDPICSLSMLYRLGWRIEEIDNAKTLVAPPALPKYISKGECS